MRHLARTAAPFGSLDLGAVEDCVLYSALLLAPACASAGRSQRETGQSCGDSDTPRYSLVALRSMMHEA